MTWHGRWTPFVQAQPRPKATGVLLGHNDIHGRDGTTPSMWPSFELVRQTGYTVTSALAGQPDRASRKAILGQELAVADDAQSGDEPASIKPADGQEVHVGGAKDRCQETRRVHLARIDVDGAAGTDAQLKRGSARPRSRRAAPGRC
jgi:hypothetical protein